MFLQIKVYELEVAN